MKPKQIFRNLFMCAAVIVSTAFCSNLSVYAAEGSIAGEENTIYEVDAGYEYVVNKSGLYAFSVHGTNGSTASSGGKTGRGGTGGYGVGYIKVKKGDIIKFEKSGGTSILSHNGTVIAQATAGTNGKAWSTRTKTGTKTVCGDGWGTCNISCGDDGTSNCYGSPSSGCDSTACCTHTCGTYSCCTGNQYEEDVYRTDYYSSNGSNGSITFNAGWHNAKYTGVEGDAKQNTTTVDAPKVSGGTIDMPTSETCAYIVNVHGSYQIQYELNGGYFPDNAGLSEGDIDDWSKVVNPVRPGFIFTGWDVVSGMDENTHQIKTEDGTVYTTNATSLDYKTFTKDYVYIYNLNETGDPVKFVAHWIDAGDSDINSPDVFDSLGNKGAVTFRNTNDGLNPDSGLRVLSSSSPSSYTIVRADGTKDSLKSVSVAENYSNTNSDKTTSLRASSNPIIFDLDPVNYYQYPNTFGQTLDNQLYYTGTWTNKSVTVSADAWDGYKDEYQVNSARTGGSGIKKMKFNNGDWVFNSNAIPNQDKMTITKTYSGTPGEVTIYKDTQTVTVVDRADEQNNTVGSAWDAASKANETTRTYIDSSDESTWIKIDMQSPAIMDPEDYAGTAEYAQRYAQMYEGYNLISAGSGSDDYGWAKDNVRIVIYATDGDGSGIVAQAYCWVPDGSGIDYQDDANWQSADSTRTYTYSYEDANGITQTVTEEIPVSTRVISKNESGCVYVRDAVGNYSVIYYKADHVDKKNPIVYPEKTPVPSDVDGEYLPEDPDDPTDYDGSDSTYSYETLGTLTYDWVNSDVKISFKARDDEDENPGYSISGIYQMRIYETDENYENKKLLESSDSDSVSYVNSKQGVTHYIVEVEDRANNITDVQLTIKLDKTAPVIVSKGGNKLDYDIQDIDLNDYGINEVENAVKDSELMKRDMLFNVSDYLDSKNGEVTDTRDSSGIESVVIRLINSADDSDYKDYKLNNVTGTELNTLEFASESTIKAILASKYDDKVDTFKEFPNAATLKYTITITDRAGNIKVYKNSNGNEIKNFSIKAVIYYSNANEDVEDESVADSGSSSYAQLNIEDTDENGKDTNTPYFRTGDFGYVEAWTVGYVPKIQFNFGDVGLVTANNIACQKLSSVYNLGITSNLLYARQIGYTCGEKINTGVADVNGVPYATHYGGKEKIATTKQAMDTFKNYFKSQGTAIRISPYYELKASDTKKKDGTTNYNWEVHSAEVTAIKGNGSYTAKSHPKYVLWDSSIVDVHHRITHES